MVETELTERTEFSREATNGN